MHCDVAYLGESLIRYRSHAGAVTARWWQTLNAIREAYLAKQRVLARFGERMPDRAAADHTARWIAAKHALRLARRHCGWREYAAARECVAFAGEVYPPILQHPRGRYVRAKIALEAPVWAAVSGLRGALNVRRAARHERRNHES
jgi:hypothetical protein